VTHFVLGGVQTKVGWKCDCGRIGISDGSDFKRSFRCRTCVGGETNAKHKRSGSRLYAIWRAMKSRVSGSQGWRARRYYFEKGITVCQEWRDDFAAFEAWALAHGYRDGLSIDRVNPTLGYFPDNCEWVTPGENSRRARQGWRQYRYIPMDVLWNAT
jgi:hypothetical protein